MLLDKNGFDKKKNGKAAVGYDLGDRVSQISYCYLGDTEPRTVSTVAGSESYNIPTALCKRFEVNQWYYGKEAIKEAGEGEGTLVEHLVTLAAQGLPVEVEGESFNPAALLTLFMKRSLALLSIHLPLDRIEVFMITVENLTGRMAEVLTTAAEGLGLRRQSIFFQNHTESFYYYTISQPKELWAHQVILYDFTGPCLITRTMHCNKKTTPVAVFIETEEYPEVSEEGKPARDPSEEAELFYEQLDLKFLSAVNCSMEGRIVTSAYLIGEGFFGDWPKESLKAVCQNRRVFQGNNLYSKGACHAAAARLQDFSREYVFLGEEKLKANVGMKVLRRGEDSYFALLDAGENWFEASRETEILLETDNVVTLYVTPLTGSEIEEDKIRLDGLAERPDRTVRLRVAVKMTSEHILFVEVEDLGFGELFPATGQIWQAEFEI